jgi:hypothetical protein
LPATRNANALVNAGLNRHRAIRQMISEPYAREKQGGGRSHRVCEPAESDAPQSIR